MFTICSYLCRLFVENAVDYMPEISGKSENSQISVKYFAVIYNYIKFS